MIKNWLCHFFCQLWVTVFSLPPLLFYFQSFHLESIFYNLFIPYLISIGMWITASCLFLKLISKDLGNFFLKLIYQVYDELFFIIKKPLVKNWEFLSQSFGLVFLISACVVLLQLVFFLERKKTKAR
jgi:predicted membrane metal-binding protein